MSEVYLAIYSAEVLCLAPIETIVTLFTIKYCDSSINVKLVPSKQKSSEQAYTIDLSKFVYEVINEIPRRASLCELPNFICNENSCVAGLCAVLRQIVKNACTECSTHHCKTLLGFKNSCLLACSEASVWTKFCEVDLILTLKSINKNVKTSALPISLARFECHMSQPVRVHNLYKYTMSKKFSMLNIAKQDGTGLPEHVYAEGSYITLADIIIFVCMHILLNTLSSQTISTLLPLTTKWYNRMLADRFIIKCLNCLPLFGKDFDTFQYTLPTVVNESLYKRDTARYKPKNRIYTRQEDITHSLQIVENMMISIRLDTEPFGADVNLDWSTVPFDATPEGGCLPQKRLRRKQEQLQNLCKSVLKVAKAGDTIVDFCTGSGHLGILIAYLLPRCTVILLENKEESLNRAKERVQKMKLINVKFCQCNLVYFKGNFDIGTSLHACGVATDLVIQCCIQRDAIFASCPCCYGSLQDCHRLSYPRSDIFRKHFRNRDYSFLSHAADQTHDQENVKTKQGYRCMAIIDTDRKLYVQQFGYQVHLSKMTPETCSLKNHLLVGIPRDRPTRDNICGS